MMPVGVGCRHSPDMGSRMGSSLAASNRRRISNQRRDAGKLDALRREGEWRETCPEFPGPQVRSALIDLMILPRLENLGLQM
jgi:hypothetical protein